MLPPQQGQGTGVRATIKSGFHKAGQVARGATGKVIQAGDTKRLKPRDPQALVAAHVAQTRELVVLSRMVPDHLRIQHTAELALNTYKKHIGAEHDYKGLYYCAFGNAGYLVGISLGVDIASLLLPALSLPFGLDIHADVKVNFKGGAIKHLLLIIHRGFPKGLFMYETTFRDSTTGQLVDHSIWRTVNPVSFLSLAGWEKRFEVGLEFDAGVSAGLAPFNIDGNSLSLNLFNLNAGIKGGGRFHKLEDPLPGYYATVTDPRLEIDFARYANPNKEVLKGLINEWRKHLRDEIFRAWKKSTDPYIKSFMDLLNERLTLDISISRGITVGSSEQVMRWLNIVEWYFRDLHTKRLIQLTPTDWDHFFSYLNNARTTLSEAKWQADWAQATDRQLPPKVGYESWTPDQLKQANSRCRANITVWAFGANASVSTGGSAAQEFNLGTFFQALPGEVAEAASLGASLNLGAGTEIKGNARFMSSRYQTETPSTKGINLVMTQDTKVAYTQVVWNYHAAAALSLPFDFEIGPPPKEGAKLFKNDMNYYSVIAYWQAPVPSPGIKTVQLEEGSGLNLGCSIAMKTLLELKRNPVPGNKKIKRYPYHSGLSINQFLAFVKSIPDTLFDPAFMQDNPYILMETCFRFAHQQTVQIRDDGKIEGLCSKFFGFGGSRSKFPPVVIESIRLRVRLGSDLDQSGTAFKLGLHIAGVAAGVGIEKIRRAGNMFVKDIYIADAVDLISPPPMAGGQPQSAGPAAAPPPVAPDRDRKVPATVLLPHSFQIDD